MAGQRQPIDLVIAKGKKHLTKEEIEERFFTSPQCIVKSDYTNRHLYCIVLY